MKKNILVASIVGAFLATPAMALEKGEHSFNAFGTLGVSSFGGEKDVKYGSEGQIQDKWRADQHTKAAAQFSYGITDRLGLTAQTIIEAEKSSYKANVEKLYLSYKVQDDLNVRAGRLRTPFYMLSETKDEGHTYPWISLPDEVYAQAKLSNFEGVDLTHEIKLDSSTSLTLQGLYGQATNRDYYLYDELNDVDYKDIIGANAQLNTLYGDFRLGYIQANMTFDDPMFRVKDDKAQFTSLGYKYDEGGLINYTEFTRRVISGDTNTVDSYYTTFGYHIDKFTPHVTYAKSSEKNSGSQISMTYGVSYDLNTNVKLKTEYKRVDTNNGYAGNFMEKGINIGLPNTYDGDIVSFAVDFKY